MYWSEEKVLRASVRSLPARQETGSLVLCVHVTVEWVVEEAEEGNSQEKNALG